MHSSSDGFKEYTLSIATNDIRKAITKLENALSDWLEDRLSTTEDESELQFAIEMRSVIARHREQLSYDNDAESPDRETDDDADAFEIIDE
jgi:hypothetical protein